MEPRDSFENVTIRVQRFKIKDPVPGYDRLRAEFAARYDMQVWNEFIASINYAIGTYTNNPENYTSWNPSYLCWARMQIFLICFGFFIFFVSEIGLPFGFIYDNQSIKILCYIGFILSVLCAIFYLVLFFHLRSIKAEYAQNVHPLVQNALNLLNTKYQNQCIYTITKLYGSAQFDLGTTLICKIKIKLLIQRVNYISQQIDGDGHQQPQQVVVQMINPYQAVVNDGGNKPLVDGEMTI